MTRRICFAEAPVRITRGGAVLFMVVEHFRNQDANAIYRRLRERGRSLPDGLTFVESWVTADLSRCFQVMACEDVTLLQQWVAEWSDLIEFEILPVVPGSETAEALREDR